MFVELRRGSIVESRHAIHVAVVDADGRLVARAGDPDLVAFWRSAAKPFQALPLVEDGVAERFGLEPEELTLACASHSSEPEQVERVRGVLRKIGCVEGDLVCGPHRPLCDAVARDYEQRGIALGAVHSNCSGKHAGMLALAKHHGWPTAGYARLEHPVQQRCLDEISRWTDLPRERIGVAVDGCGVATFALPIRNMAWAYARLGIADGSIADFGLRIADLPGEVGTRLAACRDNPQSAIHNPQSPVHNPQSSIIEAMLKHPGLIAGSGRPCTVMMQAQPGRVVTKVGAEGVYCAVLIREGLGVALKVEDGHGPSAALAMAAVLVELGLDPPDALRATPLTNSRGETVGELRVNGGLTQ